MNSDISEPEFIPNKSSIILIVGVTLIGVPLALVLWLGNQMVAIVNADDMDSKEEVIAPVRWLVSVSIPVVLAIWGYRKSKVNFSGAVFGLFSGFILTISNYAFIACLIACFFAASKATSFNAAQKRKMEENYHEGGLRNWVQVVCNVGTATLFAVYYIADVGCGERPIDFQTEYRASWLSIGVLGSLAAACGDTLASELGSVISSDRPFLITNLKPVPRGTNGGVSWVGLWSSYAGGLLVGFINYLVIIYTVDGAIQETSPSQWPLILIGGIAGFIGSLLDSILGATMQYSGYHKKLGIVVGYPGKDIVHISGKNILDNHGVNLLCNIIMGLLSPIVANYIWPNH